MLRLAPAITLSLLLIPLLAGLIGTILPAFGYLEAIGGTALGLDGWRVLFAAPGIERAVWLTLASGLLATLLSLLLAAGFCAAMAERPAFPRLRSALALLLASPPSTMALGFAFLVMPSGWLVRLVSPWLTGWDRPPVGLATVQDPLGLSFVAGLLLKEVPYLVLMTMAASAQVPVARTMAAACALGQPPALAWVKTVFPQIYPQIRLPVFAVMAFSLSAVDVAMILAPGQPPPLAVIATRWFADADLQRYFPAAAAAVLQLVIVLGAILVWRLAEIPLGWLGRRWIERGGTSPVAAFVVRRAADLAALLVGLGLLALAAMGVWSIAGIWRFPDLLPAEWRFGLWLREGGPVLATAGTTAIIGIASAALALVLALACLENEARGGGRPATRSLWLLYLPLLVPQIGFLFGVQVALIRLDLDGTLVAVVWVHAIFVVPYVFLSLADPFRALDRRQIAAAAALGAGPCRIFLAVKLPILLRPILIAAAVGFAVSVGQYLPTLFAGAGRIVTLTTEAVTLAGGADRRLVGMLAVLQASLPLAGYGLALAAPALLYRNRRDLAR
ncbi:ABC transporter permease [Geminicoccus roseus]|uniref:ABC transporter permease n=1 Tax=Geminicoccus roseus TaxID=404900 RepID=UPI0003F50136|nr:ABC transporter permease [Geminicoccus roseus]